MPITKATLRRIEERMKTKFPPQTIRCFVHFQDGTVEHEGERYQSLEDFRAALKPAADVQMALVYSWETDALYLQTRTL